MKFKCQIVIIIVLASLTVLKYLLDANAQKGELRLVWKRIKDLLPLIIALMGIFSPVLLQYAENLDKPSFTARAEYNLEDPFFTTEPVAIGTAEAKYDDHYEVSGYIANKYIVLGYGAKGKLVNTHLVTLIDPTMEASFFVVVFDEDKNIVAAVKTPGTFNYKNKLANSQTIEFTFNQGSSAIIADSLNEQFKAEGFPYVARPYVSIKCNYTDAKTQKPVSIWASGMLNEEDFKKYSKSGNKYQLYRRIMQHLMSSIDEEAINQEVQKYEDEIDNSPPGYWNLDFDEYEEYKKGGSLPVKNEYYRFMRLKKDIYNYVKKNK